MFPSFNKLLHSCGRLLKLKYSRSIYQICGPNGLSRLRLWECRNFISRVPNGYKKVLGVSVLSWLGFIDDDEKKESELIMTLKRGILAHRQGEYNKAEQLFHVALRIAQQQHNDQGVTYCFDLMANVALDNHQLDKAQKLFFQVLERLIQGGLADDDLKVIHISLKLTRIYHLKGNMEAADIGYNWCLNQIKKKQNTDFDSKMLYGVVQDWYAQFSLDTGDVKGSLEHLKEACSVCSETLGEASSQSMLLLNDLGTVSWRAGNMEDAENFLNQAIKLGNIVEDKSNLGVVHANLGLIFLEKGIIKMAEKYCNQALHLGNQHKNKESVDQANYCFEQIKTSLSK